MVKSKPRFGDHVDYVDRESGVALYAGLIVDIEANGEDAIVATRSASGKYSETPFDTRTLRKTDSRT